MASLKISLLFTLSLLLVTTPQPSLSLPFQSLPFSSYQTLFSLAHSLASRVANLRAARGDLAGAARARSFAQKIQPGIGLSFWRFMLSAGWDCVRRDCVRNYSWRDVGSVSAAWGLVSDLNESMSLVNELTIVSDLNELMSVVNELTRVDSNVDKAVWVQRNYKNVLRSVSVAWGLVSDLNELMSVVNELTRVDSNVDRATWVQRNYKNVLRSVSVAWGLVSDLNELMSVVNELTKVDSNVDRATWVQRNYKNVPRVTKSMLGRLNKLFYQQGPLREVVQMLQKEVVEGELLRDCLELGSGDLKALIQIMKDIALQYSSTSRNNEL